MTPPRVSPPSPPAVLLRLYALLLWSYPRQQHRRFAPQMLLMLEETWRQQRLAGRRPAWAFWSNAYRDVLFNAAMLRFSRGRIREQARGGDGRSRSPRAAQTPLVTSTDRSLLPLIEVLLENIAQDVRYALRTIRRAPGFSAAVVLTLMLGIGANAAIFTVLNGIVLTPLPYPAAERLVHVWTQFPEQDVGRFEVSQAEFTDYRTESALFEEMFAYRLMNLTLTGVGTPMRTRAVVASAGIWDVLGGRAVQGRLYGAEDDKPGNDQVIVLDHGFWQQTFGGDPAVIGTTVTLDGFPFEVIGVAAPGFAVPEPGVAYYAPLAIDTANLTERSGHGLWVVGRTEPGVTLDDVLAEMAVVSARWEEQYDHAHPFTAARLVDDIVGGARRPLFVLAGAVALVLLIACANVAGLLMARATSRQREIGVRAALGARRARLLRQILIEGMVLASAGGALGWLIADRGTRLLLRLEPGDLPRLQEVSNNGAVAAFVVVVSLLAGIGFAAFPAWRASRFGAALALAANPRTTSGTGRHSFQRAMVTVEVAVAIVLVIGAGLLARSFAELTHVDPGLQPDNLFATRLSLPPGSYRNVEDVQAFWYRLRDELDAAPGVEGTALVRALPLRDEAFAERFLREGETEESATATGHLPSFDWQLVFPGYFSTLGVPLLSGRDFNEFDRAGSPRVAIVTEALVQRYFEGEDPVGRRIRILASNPREVPFEIIGVAGDVRHEGLDAAAPIQIFTPFAQAPDYRPGLLWTAAVVVRASLEPGAAATTLREAVWDIDPELPLAPVSTMNQVLRDSVARPRFTTLLLTLFSGLALVLACVGIYGVVAYNVAQRTREMGIRMALGCPRGRIITLVLREGMTPVAAGVGIGIVGALFVTRLMESLLFGISPSDPATFVGVTALLTVTALFAAWVPARRATRVDPLTSLRAE